MIPRRAARARQLGRQRTAADDACAQSGLAGDGVEQDEKALLGDEAAEESDGDRRARPLVRLGDLGMLGDLGGAELGRIDAERDHVGHAGEPLGDDDGRGIRIACRDAGSAAQRPPLEPAKWQGVALGQVLRRVEHERRALATQGAQQQDLGGREGERLFVDIDDVPILAQGAPDRARVVDEEGGMRAHRGKAGHLLVWARRELHETPALAEAGSGEE